MTLFYPWPESDALALFIMRLVIGVGMVISILAACIS